MTTVEAWCVCVCVCACVVSHVFSWPKRKTLKSVCVCVCVCVCARVVSHLFSCPKRKTLKSVCVCVCVCVRRFARVLMAETENAEIRVCL